MQLYGYWRSSAAYRVRIALNLKQLSYDNLPVHLIKNGGEQHSDRYKLLNPAELVPTLIDDGLTLNQSLAIIEYLDEVYPEPSLLPQEPAARALVRALALDIACDIHPLNNLRVLQYLTGPLAINEAQKLQWITHWRWSGVCKTLPGSLASVTRSRWQIFVWFLRFIMPSGSHWICLPIPLLVQSIIIASNWQLLLWQPLNNSLTRSKNICRLGPAPMTLS